MGASSSNGKQRQKLAPMGRSYAQNQSLRISNPSALAMDSQGTYL
jgi:hypothetical protein